MVEKAVPKDSQKNKLITILGPTASGKTTRAVDLARHISGEIISADSRQIYKGMDLGTGKDLEEYGDIPYHLIDICKAGEKYNLHRFLKDFKSAVKDIENKGNNVVVCGGTGLYLETALSGIILPDVAPDNDLRKKLENLSLEELTRILKQYKKLHNTTDIDNEKRAIRAIEIEEYYARHPQEKELASKRNATPLKSLIIGIEIPREKRRENISARLLKRLEMGMVKEVEALIASGVSPESLIYYGLEYKYLTLYVMGQLKYDEMVKELEIAIHQFAKRQMTWFRGMERRGFKINWLPYDMERDRFVEEVVGLYTNFI